MLHRTVSSSLCLKC